jgi:hypothetical protein
MCTTCHHELNTLLHQHIKGIEDLKKQLLTKMVVSVDEFYYATANQTSVTLQPQSYNLEEIHTLIAYVGQAGGATLTLGARTWPLAQGTTFWYGLKLRITNSDVRTLVATTAGQMSLELMGIEVPDKGPF